MTKNNKGSANAHIEYVCGMNDGCKNRGNMWHWLKNNFTFNYFLYFAIKMISEYAGFKKKPYLKAFKVYECQNFA